jgi:hypothetical protein
MIDEIRVSYSSMKDARACLKRYWYRVNMPKSAIPNVHMIFGSIVHDSLERLEKKDRELTKLIGWSLHEWDRRTAESGRGFLGAPPKPPKSIKRMYEKYIEFIKPKLEAPPQDDTIEKFFKIPLVYELKDVDVSFVGKIDRISNREIYDWKTSAKLPDSYDLHDTQFYAYWWAYLRLFNEHPKGVFYGHLGSGNVYNISMKKHLLANFEMLLDNTVDLLYNAWERNEFPREMGYQCKGCVYRVKCYGDMAQEDIEESARETNESDSRGIY